MWRLFFVCFFKTILFNLVSGNPAFIGLHKMDQGSGFTNWINNANLTFEGWNPQNPSTTVSQDCVYIQQGLWVNYYCDKVVGYICEKNVTFEKLTYQ
jgi:Lectin C-type domain